MLSSLYHKSVGGECNSRIEPSNESFTRWSEYLKSIGLEVKLSDRTVVRNPCVMSGYPLEDFLLVYGLSHVSIIVFDIMWYRLLR